MTARVIETAKFCRPRALTGPAATEGSSGGSGVGGGGVQLAKKSAWNELREASRVSSIHDSPHTGTYSWCVFVAPVLLGTVSDSPLFNLERAAAERRILEAER